MGEKKKTVPINLWEIVTEEDENTSLLNVLPNIDEKVVLLYLESFAKEGDLCTSIDCDNQGIEQGAYPSVKTVGVNVKLNF